MKKIVLIGILISQLFFNTNIYAQENPVNSEKIALLKEKKEDLISEEKEALKKEVIEINERLDNEEITVQEADELKLEAADKHALNIKNKSAIIDNSIALLERGESDEINEIKPDGVKIVLFDFENGEAIVSLKNSKKPKKFDKRTYSNFVMALGLNNAIIEGQSFNNSPYRVGKSRFFEIGWAWSTRLLNNSNAVRFRYGFSFTFNRLNPIDNLYFVQDGNLTYLDEFYTDLTKSKLRMDNLVFPLHFEFGPSKKIERENYIRYSSKKKFKYGIGGYVGLNLSTRQKLVYYENGAKRKDKIKKSYNTSNLIYGLSSYIGYSVFSLYTKYDLNNIFNSPNRKENNISLGIRFDL
jgi:hypothetical protein